MQSRIIHRTITGFTVVLCLALATPAPGADEQRELVLLNWSDYIDPELVATFEKQHNVKIHRAHYETDDMRDKMMIETEARGADLVIVNGAMIDTYRKRGWLAEVSTKQVPNLKYIDKRWLQAFDGVDGHAVPYFWGTLGIAYRADLVDVPPRSWMDLFEPAEAVQGKLAMVDSQRDILGMALKALGFSANSTDSREISQATELLIRQKPHVRSYNYLTMNEHSAIVNGDVAMAMIFSGDALTLQEYQDNIRYVVPQEGGNLWVDYIVVLNSSSNKALAYEFIDFINEPANAAQLAEFVYFATPNTAAEKLLPATFLENPVIYPDKQSLARCESYKPLPPRAIKKRNSSLARLNSL